MNVTRAVTLLKKFALGYPAAWEDYPWDHWVAKVGKKIFVVISNGEAGELYINMKLPVSSGYAIGFPFAAPSGYGLGKASWVRATFAKGDDVPVDLLREWIDESYRAIAPKKFVAQLTS